MVDRPEGESRKGDDVRIVECEQRTPEWYAARAGKLTGSKAKDMLATIRSGEAAARRDLRASLAVEILTGKSLDTDGFVNKEMQRGIDLEPAALAAYEALSGNIVRRTGFILHDSADAGCSLDGDIDGCIGLLEIKCPKIATHVGYIRAGKLPLDYVPQVLHNFWVTGAKWLDFLSYDDRLPEALQTFLIRVYAKDMDIEDYARSATGFLAEVKAEVASLNELILARAA